MFGKLRLDYFVLSENNFPSAEFYIENFEIRNRRDRDKNGGGLIEFVRKGFITKKIKEYETKVSETFFCLFLLIHICSTPQKSFFKGLFCVIPAIAPRIFF